MMRAGQRCQVKVSRPHVEVSPPPLPGILQMRISPWLWFSIATARCRMRCVTLLVQLQVSDRGKTAVASYQIQFPRRNHLAGYSVVVIRNSRHSKAALPDGAAIKGRNTSAKLAARFPAPGKCTSQPSFGLGSLCLIRQIFVCAVFRGNGEPAVRPHSVYRRPVAGPRLIGCAGTLPELA